MKRRKRSRPQKIALRPPFDPGRRYPMAAAAAYLAISRERLYMKLKAGELVSIMDGRRRFIPGSEIARLCRAPSN